MDKQINKLFFIINGTQRKIFNLNIVTKNNSLETCAGSCLCQCKTFSLVPDSTESTKSFVTEKCSALFVSPKSFFL